MHDYQQAFIQLALENQALKFGQFTLKSGRISPYFFNAGLFNTGIALSKIGQFYASTILEANINFDILFGPAYKGIPLVSSTAIAFAHHYQKNLPYCFNRKEAKDHGEGGIIIGHPLEGRVLLIDDVITAGTAIQQSLPLFADTGAQLAGVVVMLNRQERGKGALSAIQEIEQTHQIPVLSIISLQDILDYLTKYPDENSRYVEVIEKYRLKYGEPRPKVAAV